MTAKRFTVTAIYKVEKELTVTVPEGADPHDEGAWLEIECEHDVDCHLYDVVKDSAKAEGEGD